MSTRVLYQRLTKWLLLLIAVCSTVVGVLLVNGPAPRIVRVDAQLVENVIIVALGIFGVVLPIAGFICVTFNRQVRSVMVASIALMAFMVHAVVLNDLIGTQTQTVFSGIAMIVSGLLFAIVLGWAFRCHDAKPPRSSMPPR